MSYDHAVILAGGRGSRLTSYGVPEFEKPLVQVNGARLIEHSLRFARDFGVNSAAVVANPIIAERVSAMSREHETVVVQHEPTGVLDAVSLGLDLAADRTLVLCSDNTFAPDGAWLRARCDERVDLRLAVAVRNVSPEDARHLTRVARRERLTRRGRSTLCWVGPLVARTELLAYAARSSQQTLEDSLNLLRPLTFIDMRCEDHGR